MVSKISIHNFWYLSFLSILSTATLEILGIVGSSAFAQSNIVPDDTLGNEKSQVLPLDKNAAVDTIKGGAVRGSNLFHSFQEFNVGAGRGVYFFSPSVDIQNILTRVTGSNPSEILGILGTLGNSQPNLFLINPNGILFGENASLDLQGSFTATTANGIKLGEDKFFSASEPQKSNLLSVEPGALFFNQVAAQPRNIVNRGNLAVGKDFTLAGNSLDLQGQLLAGGDLKLQGTDTVKVRDSVENPFIAAAKGELLVQGSKNVDIFALSHPDSGLFSGGDMILRSANQVAGDSKYWSGGNFRIEQLDGSLGDLFSPYDPVIWSLGDVSFNNYFGVSLHILAGGSVNIGTAGIIGADSEGNSISPITTPDLANVTLSDGTQLVINGNTTPTLDVRAGMKPEAIFSPLGINGDNISEFVIDNLAFSVVEENVKDNLDLNPVPTSANITVGKIGMNAAANGLIFLTNQYKPNTSLSGGDITISGDGIDASYLGNNASSVFIDARNNIQLIGSSINSSSDIGNRANSSLNLLSSVNGGDITLNALGNIIIDNAAISSFSNQGNGGDFKITNGGDINISNSEITTGINSQGKEGGMAGNIKINSSGNVLIENSLVSTKQNNNSSFGTSNQNAGDISIEANSLSLLDGGALDVSSPKEGNAGNVNIEVSDTVTIAGFTSKVVSENSESEIPIPREFKLGGNTEINTPISGILSLSDLDLISPEKTTSNQISPQPERIQLSSINSSIKQGNKKGDAGEISIIAGSLSLTNGGQINAANFGQGKAGDIIVDIRDALNLSGISTKDIIQQGKTITLPLNSSIVSTVGPEAEANAGFINIVASSILMADLAEISVSTFGKGNAGNISIKARDNISLADLSSIRSVLEAGGTGKAGDIHITTRSLNLTNGAQIATGIFQAVGEFAGGDGKAGSISVDASEEVNISGVSSIKLPVSVFNPLDPSKPLPTEGRSSGLLSITEIGASGTAGNITVNTKNFQISNGGVVNAKTENPGDGGNISITTDTFEAKNGGQILTTAFSSGKAGNIIIDAPDKINLTGSDSTQPERLERLGGNIVANDVPFSGVFANTSANSTTEGGSINLETKNLNLADSAQISAQSQGTGKAGNITIKLSEILSSANAEITTNSEKSSGGAIDIEARNIRLFGNSNIRTDVANGEGGGGNINIKADSIVALDQSDILSFAPEGQGGNIKFDTKGFFSTPLYTPSPQIADKATLESLDENTQVDVNASGTINGDISGVPDITFIENSLSDLQQNPIDTNALIANSCIARSRKQESTFNITGAGGLPQRPGDAAASNYPTGEVQNLSDKIQSSEWQPGYKIIEPQGVYELPSGKLILSRECD